MTIASPPAVEYFDALAPTYGQRYGSGGGLWHRYFFEGRRRIALEWLADVRGETIADVGSGPAPLAGVLARQGCRTLAFDRSESMLHQAAANGASAAAADALSLPLRDGSCAAATALGLASYVDDLAALMREMARVVRPGGTVVVSVATKNSLDWTARRWLRGLTTALGMRGVLTSGIELRTRTPAEWRKAARAAGLTIEDERGHDFTLFPLSRLLPGPAVHLGRALEAMNVRGVGGLASEVVLRLRVGGSPPSTATLHPESRSGRRRSSVVRVIARLNVGGPAMHALLLTRRLEPEFETVLATGRVSPGEEEATHLIHRFAVEPRRIPGLGRRLSLFDDLRAFGALLSLIRRERPGIVHTHTAKAGALGRVAAWLCRSPVVVHTFHGHVFRGYFGRLGSAAAVAVERQLARITDAIVAVSDEVRSDLVDRYRVAPVEKVRVLNIGLPLEPFRKAAGRRGEFRAQIGLGADTPLAAFVGRLVPVKEPVVALEAWERVRRELPEAVLAVVGAGPLFETLRARGDAGVLWLGWRQDVASVMADADVALLTSRNEGTPVALIEASAAGVPSVATDVGGVPSVVEHGKTGLLAPRGDADALAAAIVELFRDAERRRAMGAAARERASRWSAERLVRDVSALYRDLSVTAHR